MFQLQEVTVDDMLLRYHAVGDPSSPSILFIADLTLDPAPAISLSRHLAGSYHLVLLPLPAAGLGGLALEDIPADTDAFLPELVTNFAEAVGLTQFALYAVGSLVTTAWWIAQKHRARLLAVVAQHDYSKGVDVTAPWYDLPPGMSEDAVRVDSSVGSGAMRVSGTPCPLRSTQDDAAIPTLVIIGDQGVALPSGADRMDLPSGHLIYVRRFDTTHFSLDSFHCEIAAEVDEFLHGLMPLERSQVPASRPKAEVLAKALA